MTPVQIFSAVLGWIYTVAWGYSFVPQFLVTYRLKHTEGLSRLFVNLNLIGFAAYLVYNVLMMWWAPLRQEYFKEHPGAPEPVYVSDLIFTIWSFAATMYYFYQIFLYRKNTRPYKAKLHLFGWALIAGFWYVMIYTTLMLIMGGLDYIPYVNILGAIKIGTTLIKMAPQAILNYRRKSTVGWSIGAVSLDFFGGFCSLVQMCIDCAVKHNWDEFTDVSNLPKLGLASIAIVFDAVFFYQHYVLYNVKRTAVTSDRGGEGEDEDEKKKLLS